MTEQEFWTRAALLHRVHLQVLYSLHKEGNQAFDSMMADAPKHLGKKRLIYVIDCLQRARLIVVINGWVAIRREVRQCLNSMLPEPPDHLASQVSTIPPIPHPSSAGA
ncbi:MAG: hypothetical protein COU35_02930 [Candidatus Magasanikbacteria bacterium CG10_big_fil_rev_8_21_14_0_10_47_10]|uniref:Uncharacterized protein n=1 Tax=Candidatus Magasanikbacteria bacterium CG10_big_fil_rev_8_21_14_0_10_47_10 TaxID=1974652 RepID=A0A2H0TQF0_9BACT|nr:MAG: hypothetical protein COU35_02930 [Candidatus Magasanikbacteria bacterium CG10_big_fil_rev_8_21_14_0_10_47_10]